MGGDYVLVVKFSGGGLCPSCKIQRGGLCPSCKIHGGDFVHVYKNEQGGFCPGGFCPTLALTAMFCSIVWIQRITTIITGKNVSTLGITGEMLVKYCFSRKVSIHLHNFM